MLEISEAGATPPLLIVLDEGDNAVDDDMQKDVTGKISPWSPGNIHHKRH